MIYNQVSFLEQNLKAAPKVEILRMLRYFQPFPRLAIFPVFFLHFLSNYYRCFQGTVRKVHSSSKFWAWVCSHTTILKS